MTGTIAGYRELSEDELALIDRIKEGEVVVRALISDVAAVPEADQRAAALALSHIQTGFMWLVRAIARPAQ
jgi:hypothetical protein